jgi:hypothetical protein
MDTIFWRMNIYWIQRIDDDGVVDDKYRMQCQCQDGDGPISDDPRIHSKLNDLSTYAKCARLMPVAQIYIKYLLSCYDPNHLPKGLDGIIYEGGEDEVIVIL